MAQIFPINFENLASSKIIAEFCKIIWDLLGIPMSLATVAVSDKDKLQRKNFSSKQQMHPICQVIRSTEEGLARCLSTDLAGCNRAINDKHGIHYACHAGLIDFAVPIYIDGQFVATITGGQILPERPTNKGFKKLWESLKHLPISKDALRKAYFKSSYMSEQQIESLMNLVSFFVDYYCEVGKLLECVARQDSKFLDIVKAKNYIDNHFREPITISEASEQACLSEAYFSRTFKKALGSTFTQYIQFLRLTEAKKLLKNTDMQISRIAFLCGFNNLSYFNELFRKTEKCSPTEFRNGEKRTKRGHV
jgi:AraC-like DNA-binding protein/ligand-binding sensor protein